MKAKPIRKKNTGFDLKQGITETETHIRCRQTQCGFYIKGGCKPCELCNADPFILKKSCETCYNCENVPGELRWDDPEMKKLEQEIAEHNEKVEKLLEHLGKEATKTRVPTPPLNMQLKKY